MEFSTREWTRRIILGFLGGTLWMTALRSHTRSVPCVQMIVNLMSLSRTLRKLTQLPDWLNWLLSVVEPLVVLAITVVVFYTGYCLVFGPEQSTHLARFKDLMKEVNDNWKAGLLLLVLLFYRTIRIFLEQAEEAFSIKKKKPLTGESKEGTTPPTVKS